MANEIKLPALGEGLEGGAVLDVKVKPGDLVSEGQSLLEVEAEKSTVEIPAPQAGKVVKLLVKKGDQIKVGQSLCLFEGGGNGVATKSETPKAVAAPEPAKADAVEEKKAYAPVSRPPVVESKPTAAAVTAATSTTTTTLVPAGPATRKLARELGVDLARVPGTASGGRVTEDDVRAYVRQLAAGGATTSRGPSAAPPLPDFERWGPIERKALEQLRRKTAEQMALTWSLVPQVTQHDQADITDLDAFRRQQPAGGPKLTVTAFALKAAAVALKKFPQFNTSYDQPANQLVFKRYYHVGVAVDTERGLLVPVIRDVDKKSVTELAIELSDIADRARTKKLTIEEMRGGTFTITNLGGLGGIAFSPIVNYPEVAILGLSRARLEPVVRDGAITPRLMLTLSLSYDHRVVDGADAARFTRFLADLLENPVRMLL
jgi:pyruvate dehydrogenase E2 component (dihydrolipoamide acetyltransferase)